MRGAARTLRQRPRRRSGCLMGVSARVLVLGLGGTISMSEVPGGEGARPARQVSELLERVSGNVGVDSEDLRLVPGAALDFSSVLEVAARIHRAHTQAYAGVVVVQGTDTIEEVAYALHLLVADPIAVVVTGAMRLGSSLGADGEANLAAAVTVASSNECADLGVLVVMADEIHSASLVAKTSTAIPHAFRSWPGFLGQVSEGQVRLVLRPAQRPPLLAIPAEALSPRVEFVTARLGAGTSQLATLISDPPHGVIVAAFGGGHVPPSWVVPLTNLAAKCPVVLTSRTGSGVVLRETYGFHGSERDLLERGLIWAGEHTPTKAAVALTLLLMAGSTRATIASHLSS